MRGHSFHTPQNLTSLGRMLGLTWRTQPVVFLGLITLTALQSITLLASAWITKLLFDLLALALKGSPSTNLVQNLIPLLLAQSAIFVISQVSNPITSFLTNELGRNLAVVTETAVYRKINNFAGIAYFESPEFFDTFRLASQGAQFGPLQSVSILTSLFQGTVTIFTFMAVLLAFKPLLAILVLLAALPQLWLQLKFGRQRFGLAFKLSPEERLTYYISYLLSDNETAKEIRLFGLAEYLLDKLRTVYHRIHQARRHQELHELRWKGVLEALSASAFSIAFAIIALQAFSKRLSLGDVTLYINAMRSLQGALSTAILAFASLNEHALFFKEYDRLIAMPQPITIVHPSHPVTKLSHGIEIRKVYFRYNEKLPWILRNLNLSIPVDKTLALVGLNGVGKTTLVKLLTRLYDPSEGEILWDGIDIRKFNPEELRCHIGVILQDFVRYALTAQENIGFGKVEQIDDLVRIHRAAETAGINDMIHNMSQGYQTLLSRVFGENGTGAELSGGEWQKVALARLFMRDAEVLILDEPTSSLDAQAENEIYNRFIELVRGKTSLIISHRFSTVRMADRIAVLENGGISEYGSHDDLLAHGGAYAKLYYMQADRYRIQH